MLSRSNDMVNQCLSEINSISKQLQTNPDVSQFLKHDICTPSSDYYDPNTVVRLCASIGTYTSLNSNPLLDSIYLYSKASDKLIDAYSVFSLEEFYGNFIQFGDMDLPNFKNQILLSPSYNKLYPQTSMIFKGDSKNVFLYTTSYPLWEQKNNINGSIVIMVNSEALHETVGKSFDTEKNYIYFFEKDNCISKSSGAPELSAVPMETKSIQTIEGEKYLIFSTALSTGYNYVIATPYAQATKDLSNLRLLILGIIAVFILIYLIAAICLSKINAKPIRAIVRSLSNDPYQHGSNEYDVISRSITHLLDTEAYLQNEITLHLPVLVSDFVQSLISGNLTDEDEIAALCTKLKLDLEAKYYTVLLLSLLDVSPTQLRCMEIINLSKKHIKAFFSDKLHCIGTETDSVELAFIICLSGASEDEDTLAIENVVNQVSRELFDLFHIRLKASLSEPCLSLGAIFFSYQSAADKSENGLQTQYENTVWCTSCRDINASYYYPLDLENKILQSFKMDDLEHINTILDNIKCENLEKRILSGNTVTYLYFDIKGTLFKLLDTAGLQLDEHLNKLFEKLNGQMPIDRFFLAVKEIFATLMELKYNQRGGETLSSAILHYVDSQYSNPSFNRQMFAQEFAISEDYVTKFFREHTGFSFIEYLTNVRIEAACKLLVENNHSIEKISAAVGYNSAVAFRRAFKAVTGETPREYKLRHKE